MASTASFWPHNDRIVQPFPASVTSEMTSVDHINKPVNIANYVISENNQGWPSPSSLRRPSSFVQAEQTYAGAFLYKQQQQQQQQQQQPLYGYAIAQSPFIVPVNTSTTSLYMSYNYSNFSSKNYDPPYVNGNFLAKKQIRQALEQQVISSLFVRTNSPYGPILYNYI
jgi:hypothetical protein